MKDFVIIGCGRFGKSVAENLYQKGFDVMVIDKDGDRIQEISDDVTHAIEADAIDEDTLKSIGIRNFDVAVISIGEDIQASILATLIVKELGIKKIIAKAQNDIHGKVLYKVGADKVVFPERDMGIRLANSLATKNILDIIELDPNYSVIELSVLDRWIGKTIEETKLSSKHGINIIAIKSGSEINISPYASDVIKGEDILIVIGSLKDLNDVEEME